MSFRLIIVGIIFLGIVTVAGFALTQSSVQAASFTVNSTLDAVDANPGDGACALHISIVGAPHVSGLLKKADRIR